MQSQTLDAPRTAAPAARAESPPADNAPLLQCLGFALGQDRYAVRIDAVREILEVALLTPLPLMPTFVRGVMNLRGAVVPVIDLGARLGLARTAIGRRTCVVIVDVPATDADGEPSGLQTLGVLVDAVHEVFDAAAADLEPVPRLGTMVDACYIRHMVRLRGQAIAEIDLDRVLEQQALSELIAGFRTAAC